jgi:TfoX/Sxy family transcriptional regulator of competence genes
MASDREFVDFVVDQIGNSGEITAKSMFGEYGIFSGRKIIALICDNKLFIKPTESGRSFIKDVVEAPPYPGAKPSFLIGVDILHHVNEMDSISFYKTKGSTSSRVPSGSCCRPPMRFAFTQANPACPAVCMSLWFSRLLLVLNVIYLKISLSNSLNICALISLP